MQIGHVKTTIPTLTYNYLSGPIILSQLKLQAFSYGNCRFAVQNYLFIIYSQYLRPHEILLPRAYQKTGKFISNNYEVKPKLYKPGDVIFAYKKTIPINSRQLIKLHTAVFTTNNKIYHATSIIGHDTIWSMKTFSKYYEIFAVKRVIK